MHVVSSVGSDETCLRACLFHQPQLKKTRNAPQAHVWYWVLTKDLAIDLERSAAISLTSKEIPKLDPKLDLAARREGGGPTV